MGRFVTVSILVFLLTFPVLAAAAEKDKDQFSGLQILREISARIPSKLNAEVDTLTITAKTVNLGGTTGSYDNVAKLKRALEASPAIASVRILRTTADSKQVTFKFTIALAKPLARILH